MIQAIIENLKKINNPTSDKLVEIFFDKQQVVAQGYYATTIFESQSNYDKQMSSYDCKVCGINEPNLVETPLIFAHSKFPCVLPSSTNQGVAFGITLVNYTNKQPYIVLVCEKGFTDYSLKSLVFNLQTKVYTESTSSKACANTDALFDFFQSNLAEFINQFVVVKK